MGALFFHWLMQVDFKKITVQTRLVFFPKRRARAEAASANKSLAIPDVPVFRGERSTGASGEVDFAFGLNNQVRVGNSLVQHMSDVEERS